MTKMNFQVHVTATPGVRRKRADISDDQHEAVPPQCNKYPKARRRNNLTFASQPP